MNYFEHLYFSIKLSYIFARGTYCAFVHAVVPAWHMTSSTDIHDQMSKELNKRHSHYIIHKTKVIK